MSDEATQAKLQARVCLLGEHLGVPIPADWSGVDAVWPIIERIRDDGAFFFIKVDGENVQPGDPGLYTAMASGGQLAAADFIRSDFDTVESAVAAVLVTYAERVWDFPPEGGPPGVEG